MNVSIANSKAVENLTSGDVEHWMTTNHSVLATLKLHELKIPSTMHSGTFEFDAQAYTRSTPDSSGALWGIQIEAGVRALDLRICQIGAGQWVFHYNHQPSANTVQSLIDWCNAYYSVSDSTAINEILVLNIRDCYSLSGAFDYVQLKNLFVNGLQATGLIPRSAALLTLGQMTHDYGGKNIILSWDKCSEDDLIWPCRWQGWINTVVPAGVNQKAIMQMYVIHNTVTQLSSTLFVANAHSHSLSNRPPVAGLELDHALIQACISANLNQAPPAPPVVESSQYDFALQTLSLTITPGFNTSHYQISINAGSNIIYPHTLSEGRHRITVSLALNRMYQLSIKRVDAHGRTPNGILVDIDTSTTKDTDNPGNIDGPDGPWIVGATRNGDIAGYAYWGTHDLSSYDHALIKIYRSQDINEGIATGPAIFEKTLNNSATSVTFYPLEVGTDYVVTLVGVFSNLTKTKASWKKVS